MSHNHENSEICDNNCRKTEFEDVDESLTAEFIPVFLSNLAQKHSAYVEQFIKGSL